jgi:hypothetical protein
MALMDMENIEVLNHLRGCSRAKEFRFSILHPCFNSAKTYGHERDDLVAKLRVNIL